MFQRQSYTPYVQQIFTTLINGRKVFRLRTPYAPYNDQLKIETLNIYHTDRSTKTIDRIFNEGTNNNIELFYFWTSSFFHLNRVHAFNEWELNLNPSMIHSAFWDKTKNKTIEFNINLDMDFSFLHTYLLNTFTHTRNYTLQNGNGGRWISQMMIFNVV